MSTSKWRAIQFNLGSSPSEMGGAFISSLSGALGRAGISIFFFTTFNADLVLVEESNFEAAKMCLKANYPIVWADEESSSATTTTTMAKDIAPNTITSTIPPRNHSSEDLRASISRLQSFPLLKLCMYSLKPQVLTTGFRDLLELLFYSNGGPHRFLSLTISEDELSLIADADSIKSFPRENLEVSLNEKWIPVKRAQKAGFSEVGVISAISTPLASLSMLYLSSYQTSWLLLKQEDYDTAVHRLTNDGFVVYSD